MDANTAPADAGNAGPLGAGSPQGGAAPGAAPSEFLDTTFHDERGRLWEIRLTLPLVHAFIRKHNIPMGGFTAGVLREDLLAELAYDGTRHFSRAKASEETLEEFLQAFDGPAYQGLLTASTHAVLNFTLRTTVKKSERAAAVVAIRNAEEKVSAALGLGRKCAAPAEPQASTPPSP